jgi:hypothetical protein
MRMSRWLLCGAAVLLAGAAQAQPMDPDFAKTVKEWTTRPEFLSPLVDHLPLSDTIPSPKKVLGDHIGVPNKLHHQDEILAYYRALEKAAPDRVKIFSIGKSEEGRENIVVMISSAANIAKLDTYRANLNLLADPRKLDPARAAQVIADTKPIYMVTAGLHSAETGPPEMMMELSYRLLTEKTPFIQGINDNVVVAIQPVLEPDGRDRYVDWYHQSLVDETDDLNKPGGPPYWGKYIYHDNNRDINFSNTSAQGLLKFYLAWKIPIMHELHESVPFMYTYSGQAPQNPDLDPILYGELPFFSNYEMSQMSKYGMPGVWTHGFVDAWSPGYVAFMASNHNGMLRMYETFGNGGATTMLRHVAGDPQPEVRGGAQTERDWYRPWPAYKEVVWSMRNNTNYMETGVLTALELTSKHGQEVIENFYKKNLNGVTVGSEKAPYGYIIPANQADMTRVKWVADILAMQGIEIGRSSAPVTTKEGTYPAGSLVIKLNQPYGRLAKTLLRKQDNYPNENLTTYDDAAWTMGLMAHINVVETADKSVLYVAAPLTTDFNVTGAVEGSGSTYAVVDNGSVNLAKLRYRLKGVPIKVAEASFQAGGKTIPAGSFLVPASALSTLRTNVASLGLTAVGVDNPSVATHELGNPRVALFSTWGSTEKVGWVRYAFDQYETPYDLIYKEQVRGGNLRAKYDVIILPHQGRGGDPKAIVNDIPMKGKPLPYMKSAKFKTLGAYGESKDIRGGMGLDGLAELEKFVEQGGTLITTGDASAVPADFGLVDNVTSSRTTRNFNAPGPIVNAVVLQPKNPIFYGYPDKEMPVRWASNVLYSLPSTYKGEILMQFPGEKKSVLSGFMKGAEEVKNRPAIISEPVGQGQVVMFATTPIWRWQNFGEFRMLYNAMWNWKNLKGAPPAPPGASADAAGN